MTNKEAIIVLKNIAWFGKIYDQEQTEEAVEMAINALIKEAWKEEHPVSPLLQKLATNLQPSKQDDLISRQAANIALWKALHNYEDKAEKMFLESDDLNIEDWMSYRIFVQNMSDIDRQTILELPSAQPERETAKFIRWMECKKTDEYISYTPHCKCSKCGTEFLIWTIKYCYVCGARMEGEQAEDGK